MTTPSSAARWGTVVRAMFVAVVKKEVFQTLRDRRLMALLLAAPAIQLILFGYAVNLDVDRVPTFVVDLDQSTQSREDLRRLLGDGTLHQVGETSSVRDAERALERGEAAVALIIPHGYEHDIRRGRGARMQSILDGGDANRAGIAGGAVSAFYSRSLGSRGVEVASRVFFNPELSTSIYMVPGVTAMLLLLITTIIASMGLAREREVGTLEQILVTPVPSWILIAGKILPFAVVGLIDFGVAMLVGNLAFDMPLRGSMGLLLVATCAYLLTTLGVGLLIATSSRSQQQAFLGGFLFMLPAALLSGILTPVTSMPRWLQPLTLANPLRHYAEVLRAVLLRGAGVRDVASQLAVLGVMGICVFVFASYRFRKASR